MLAIINVLFFERKMGKAREKTSTGNGIDTQRDLHSISSLDMVAASAAPYWRRACSSCHIGSLRFHHRRSCRSSLGLPHKMAWLAKLWVAKGDMVSGSGTLRMLVARCYTKVDVSRLDGLMDPVVSMSSSSCAVVTLTARAYTEEVRGFHEHRERASMVSQEALAYAFASAAMSRSVLLMTAVSQRFDGSSVWSLEQVLRSFALEMGMRRPLSSQDLQGVSLSFCLALFSLTTRDFRVKL